MQFIKSIWQIIVIKKLYVILNNIIQMNSVDTLDSKGEKLCDGIESEWGTAVG